MLHVDRITANSTVLMNQAPSTIDLYFQQALATLENSGLDFTAADVVALVAPMADDFKAAILARAIERLADSVALLEQGH